MYGSDFVQVKVLIATGPSTSNQTGLVSGQWTHLKFLLGELVFGIKSELNFTHNPPKFKSSSSINCYYPTLVKPKKQSLMTVVDHISNLIPFSCSESQNSR